MSLSLLFRVSYVFFHSSLSLDRFRASRTQSQSRLSSAPRRRWRWRWVRELGDRRFATTLARRTVVTFHPPSPLSRSGSWSSADVESRNSCHGDRGVVWLSVRRLRSDRVMPTCVIVESSAWTMLCLNAEKKDGCGYRMPRGWVSRGDRLGRVRFG